MNKLFITGNVVKEPVYQKSQSGQMVCTFIVAVNPFFSATTSNPPPPDYFNVSAWDKLGELCREKLRKGSKVTVIGSVSQSQYVKDGEPRASMDIKHANEIEFLSK
jgi:single stranded DNA-binding protein